MLINEKEALARFHSPSNLMNRLNSSTKKNHSMSLFMNKNDTNITNKDVTNITNKDITNKDVTNKDVTNKDVSNVREVKPFVRTADESNVPVDKDSVPDNEAQIDVDNILDNAEAKIRLSLVHDQALNVLHRAVSMMGTKLDDIKADKLPSVITAASKTVNDIRRERNESLKNNNKNVNIIFYTPTQKTLTDYEVIDV